MNEKDRSNKLYKCVFMSRSLELSDIMSSACVLPKEKKLQNALGA